MPDASALSGPTGFVIIAPDLRCNNNCLYCYGKDKPQAIEDLPSLDEIVTRTLAVAVDSGLGRVGISGGEPTLLPDLPELASRLRQGGLGVSVLTNGRALRERSWLEALVAAGVDHFHVPVHADHAGLHDAVTRVSGSFRETQEGLANILALREHVPLDLTLVHVVHAHNCNGLEAMARFLLPYRPVYVLFSYCVIQASSYEKYLDLMTPYAAVLPGLLAACDFLLQNGQAVYADNIPPCLLRGREHLCLDFQKANTLNIVGLKDFDLSESVEDAAMFQPLNAHERSYAQVCTQCAIKAFCGGLYQSYLAVTDSPEVIPYTAAEISQRLAARKCTS